MPKEITKDDVDDLVLLDYDDASSFDGNEGIKMV